MKDFLSCTKTRPAKTSQSLVHKPLNKGLYLTRLPVRFFGNTAIGHAIFFSRVEYREMRQKIEAPQ